ncbi:hypothetical protein D3C71_1767380 [compost metagenome]
MDVGGLPGVEHVAGLPGRGDLAGDRVQAVHRDHHQHPLGAAIAQPHAVAVPLLAGDPALATVAVLGQRAVAIAVDDGQVDRAAGCVGQGHRAEAAQGQHGEQGQDQAFHGSAPRWGDRFNGPGVATGLRRGR